MEDISQIILDLTQNSLAAKASRIDITIKCNYKTNLLEIVLEDNGVGMNSNQLYQCTNPFYTTRTTRNVGLGLSLTKMLCEQSDGNFIIDSVKGKGTTLRFSFKLDHWNRPPMGKLEKTYLALIILNPDREISLTLLTERDKFYINSFEIQKNIDGADISEGWVVEWLTDYLEENIYHLIKEELL